MALAETPQNAVLEAIPGTPGIREVRPESDLESFGFSVEPGKMPGGSPGPFIRRVNLRAEIDTSPPFGSVQEAVTRFGGRGSWVPYYNKFGDTYNGVEEFDIKRAEEQAAELEKDLIVKELETLDVLEELGTTKRVVEDLKRQLQQEALKCMATPEQDIKEIKEEHYKNLIRSNAQIVGYSTSFPVSSSPDLILMELKKAKLNLGKTINDLGVIQTSVESLTKKIKHEKTLLGETCEGLTPKLAGLSSLEDDVKQMSVEPEIAYDAETNYGISTDISSEYLQMNSQGEQIKKVAEATIGVSRTNEQNLNYMKTAEMRLVAARKMEEAARAAEALAIAEIQALSENQSSSGFFLPEPARSPLTPRARNPPELTSPKRVLNTMHHFSEPTFSKFSILEKLEEASEEVRYSKQALGEALNRIDIANRKQLAAGEALRRWIPENDQKRRLLFNSTKLTNVHPSETYPLSMLSNFNSTENHLHGLNNPEQVKDDIKPVLRPTVSMRDILGRKQAVPEECKVKRQSEGRPIGQKVALSQMLHELREDLKLPAKAEKDGDGQKQVFGQRRKFGFIHISLAKQSKKKSQPLNTNFT